RVRIVKTFLGPAAGYPMKARFNGKVPTILEHQLKSAQVRDGRVHLQLEGPQGPRDHVADNVIAATSYRVNLDRLAFLDKEVRAALRTTDQMPALSSTFESSARGLYFVGIASANTFGPMMRFACGADWTARRIVRALTRAAARRPVGASRKSAAEFQ